VIRLVHPTPEDGEASSGDPPKPQKSPEARDPTPGLTERAKEIEAVAELARLARKHIEPMIPRWIEDAGGPCTRKRRCPHCFGLASLARILGLP
jgi:hypothetical protein